MFVQQFTIQTLDVCLTKTYILKYLRFLKIKDEPGCFIESLEKIEACFLDDGTRCHGWHREHENEMD